MKSMKDSKVFLHYLHVLHGNYFLYIRVNPYNPRKSVFYSFLLVHYFKPNPAFRL